MIETPLAAYRALLREGRLQADPAQALAVEKLQSLHHALVGYQPASGRAGWKERFGLARRRAEPPQGLYVFGEVGRGKSMLVDLFFAAAPVECKRRVHFHAFMQEIHRRLGALRAEGRHADPIPPLAAAVAAEAWLLCFDEFHVSDIADAMILGRLFEALFDNGVVVVATSNRPPRDLYKDGLQRDRFVPFIRLIEEKLDLLELASPTDYRLNRLRRMRVYLTPIGPGTEDELQRCFQELTRGGPAGPDVIVVHGRRIPIELAAGGVACASFDTLCGRPLGPADYLQIASRYHTLVLSGIPRLTPERHNEAKRFVTLIDTLYEHRVNLICSAEAPPDQLYAEGFGAFEFRRTVSRLMEMQSEDYLARRHVTV